MDCVFCSIVAGETPADVVLETDDLLAFLDRRPVFKGHVLLIPRQHHVTLPDLPADLRDPFLAAAQRLATAMTTGLGAQGSFVAMNNTDSQSVPHLHCHVGPRTKGEEPPSWKSAASVWATSTPIRRPDRRTPSSSASTR